MTAVGSALTSAPASDRFPSSVSSLQRHVSCLGKQVCLLQTSPPWGRGCGGAEPLLRKVPMYGAHPCGGQNLSVHSLINSSIHSLPLCQVPCQAQENSEGHSPCARELSLSSSHGITRAVLEMNKGSPKHPGGCPVSGWGL